MVHSSYTLNVSSQNDFFVQSWFPLENPRAILLVIHGFGEHSSRYGSHFAEFYLKQNIGILAFDLPGHGKSSGKRGHIENPVSIIEVIDKLVQKIKFEYPNIPVIIYGHSFGGQITLWYDLVRKPDVCGIIVTSPLIQTHDDVSPAKLFLAKLMDKLYPSFSMDNGIDAKLLSRDKKVVNDYINDPLVHRNITAKTGMLIIDRGKWILENAKSNSNNLLMMVGSREGIVSKSAIDQFCQSAPNVTYKTWPGLFHELHNEPEKGEIFNFSLDWINERLSYCRDQN